MSTQFWLDYFTGTRYTFGNSWLNSVQEHLVEQLHALQLDNGTASKVSDRVARFWRQTYYASLFPLRFGCATDATGMLSTRETQPSAEVDLERLAGNRLRRDQRDGGLLPPILPDHIYSEKGWLLSDRLLLEAALLNALLSNADGVSDEHRQAARLAALTYPFHAALGKGVFGTADQLVTAIGRVLNGGTAELPAPLLEIVQAVRTQQFGMRPIQLVLVAVQRIKQYVFDTPGLNEIRGGSTLLDQITEDLADRVEQRLGPEMVLRAAGSTLLFLAPEDGRDWVQELRREYYARTGNAFPAAATVTIRAQELFEGYGPAIARVYRQLDRDRAQAALPLYTALPFEARCVLCGVRAAEGWDASPGEQNLPQNRRPLCRVCRTKRVVGQSERAAKIGTLLKILDLGQPPQLTRLGVQAGSIAERVAIDFDLLIPQSVRRRLIGVVYGDGNNFGAVSLGLQDIALGVQWAARVRLTTQTAAAIALGHATQTAAIERGWKPGDTRAAFAKLPFQVLALGGDDISLFAWGPVALHFAAEFVRLTDLEFAAHSSVQPVSDRQLTFSLGVLISDEKTPVRKSVDFTEETLLKWAKQAARQASQNSGTIALVYAPTAEAVPADLDHYRSLTYKLGAPGFQVYTSLRPFSAHELRSLLKIAHQLVQRGDTGRLQRLAAALYNERHGVLAGLLHYAYQRGRLTRSPNWIATLEAELAELFDISNTERRLFGLALRHPLGIGPLPDTQRTGMLFSPLWDLVEISKIIS